MTRAVATQPRSYLCCLRGSSWTKLQALYFNGKALFAMEALVEVLFDLYKQTTDGHWLEIRDSLKMTTRRFTLTQQPGQSLGIWNESAVSC